MKANRDFNVWEKIGNTIDIKDNDKVCCNFCKRELEATEVNKVKLSDSNKLDQKDVIFINLIIDSLTFLENSIKESVTKKSFSLEIIIIIRNIKNNLSDLKVGSYFPHVLNKLCEYRLLLDKGNI